MADERHRDATSGSELEVALRPGVYAATCGRDLVLLDVRADTYHCLRGDDEEPAIKSAGRALQLTSADLAQELVAVGLAEYGAPVGASRPPPPPPRRTVLRDHYGPPGWRDLPDALAAMWAVLRAYHGRPFEALIGGRAQRLVSLSQASAFEICDRFHRWIPFAPVSGKCLLRSFMLRRLLLRAGHEPLWIFGVQTWPFAAHCWLQIGDVVLDDHPDRVAPYAPILVV